MPTPCPGMDPYLERPALWTNVHTSLIIALRDDLAPRLRPKYYVAVEERSVRLGPDELAFAVRPDVAVVRSAPGPVSEAAVVSQAPGVLTVELPMAETIREVFLEIREVGVDRVVTVVEILSPTNKLPGPGRRDYEQKRLNLLGTLTHLVEIDLLRGGPPMPMLGYTQPSDYRILVSRAERRPQADLLTFSVRQPIPTFRLPLQPGDAEPDVDLTALLHSLYDRAGYDLRLDYREAAEPPLIGENAAWAAQRLHQVG